jgi:hypothetical protein
MQQCEQLLYASIHVVALMKSDVCLRETMRCKFIHTLMILAQHESNSLYEGTFPPTQCTTCPCLSTLQACLLSAGHHLTSSFTSPLLIYFHCWTSCLRLRPQDRTSDNSLRTLCSYHILHLFPRRPKPNLHNASTQGRAPDSAAKPEEAASTTISTLRGWSSRL